MRAFIIESMKKFILSALLPFLYFLSSLLLPLPKPAEASAAETDYACIRSENVYLYAEENSRSGLFVLPYTYYVKVLAAGINYCYVEYLSDGPYTRKITGYCKTSDLTFVDYVPDRPYLYYTFDVTYYIEGSSPALSGDGFLSSITVTCAYYGEYRVGSEIYCYVLRDDTFGYIPRPEDLEYELTDEYDQHNSEEPDTGVGNFGGETEPMTPAQIALLVLLCVLVPVIAALILRPPKKPPYETEE